MRNPLKQNETKREKFERLAKDRMTKALVAIYRIGKLNNRAMYDYEQRHIDAILQALRAQVEELEYRLAGERGKDEGSFSFPE